MPRDTLKDPDDGGQGAVALLFLMAAAVVCAIVGAILIWG